MTKLRYTEQALVLSPTVARLRAVTSLRNQLKSQAMTGIAKSLLWAKQKFFEYYNKPHRMLVSRLTPCPFNSFPDFLIQPDGMSTDCPQNITKVFGEFYTKLYNCFTPTHHPPFKQEALDAFLKISIYPSCRHLTSRNEMPALL